MSFRDTNHFSLHSELTPDGFNRDLIAWFKSFGGVICGTTIPSSGSTRDTPFSSCSTIMGPDDNQTKQRPNRRGDGHGPPTKATKLSHTLSWALRHKAPEIGMSITTAGWVPVQEFLESKHPRLRGITLEDIKEVVATSDKKRFVLAYRPNSDFPAKLSPDGEILCIRASQGHSIKTIDPNLLLTRLTPDQIRNLPCIVHGTYVDAWKSIEQQGLKTMNRSHIHFATGLPEDEQVISGMRRSATIYIYIDPQACIDDGIRFFISANGVVLTDGINGILETKYFSKVTDSTGNLILTNDTKKAASYQVTY